MHEYIVQLTMVKTPVAKRSHKRRAENRPAPKAKRTSPDVQFVPLNEVPDDVESPEHECLLHTSRIISNRIAIRQSKALKALSPNPVAVTAVPPVPPPVPRPATPPRDPPPPPPMGELLDQVSALLGAIPGLDAVLDPSGCDNPVCPYDNHGSLLEQRFALFKRFVQIDAAVRCIRFYANKEE